MYHAGAAVAAELAAVFGFTTFLRRSCLALPAGPSGSARPFISDALLVRDLFTGHRAVTVGKMTAFFE
jgi:hypothetical protein